MKPVDESAIKGAVCVYVSEMKTTGAPVERIIMDIKRVADASFGPQLINGMGAPSAPPRESLVIDRAVRWCIEHYYRTDETR